MWSEWGGGGGYNTETNSAENCPMVGIPGERGKEWHYLYCKGHSALFIAGAAELEAVVISNSCMVYAIYVLKQPFLLTGSLL